MHISLFAKHLDGHTKGFYYIYNFLDTPPYPILTLSTGSYKLF